MRPLGSSRRRRTVRRTLAALLAVALARSLVKVDLGPAGDRRNELGANGPVRDARDDRDARAPSHSTGRLAVEQAAEDPTPEAEGTRPDEGRTSRLKVHLWDDGTGPNYSDLGNVTLGMGHREKLYTKEGFSTHPRTTLVSAPDDADLIVWVSVLARAELEIPPRNYINVVMLDYADGCHPYHLYHKSLKRTIGYFRRSFVLRKEGVYQGNCSFTEQQTIFPMAYSGIEALVRKDDKKRTVSITNVLRTEGNHNKNRKRIVAWTQAFVDRHNLGNTSFVGEVTNSRSPHGWDLKYQSLLARSRIVVTCNPSDWEGDFRLWEALLSGALVLVDRMAVLDWMPHPPEHKRHLVYYDPTNETEFAELLEYYVRNEEEARRIGEAGYRHVLAHHMPADRVSYILNMIDQPAIP